MRLANTLRAASFRRHAASLAPNAAGHFSAPSPSDLLRDSRIAGLRHALLNAGSPSRVWAHYTNILNYFDYDALSLDIHRQVLRQCSPPPHALRLFAARRLMEGKKPENPHLHEGRFQTVISNIRALGHSPSLDDYHFVLEQFAAVGHYIGSLQVYQEIIHLGITPEPKTFGLCLQSLAHRLSLPVLKAYRNRLSAQTRKILDDLMADIRKYHVPLTQTNLDLALRIFKETVDQEGFDTLVKWTYGIDLSNPDCPPLEILQGQSPPSILPFSTHALNTIIDTLGRFGDISRLVQAFEVLTQPLPQAGQHIFSSFDDDDDFGVSVQVPTPSNFTPPYAQPNTTTYNMLLRHIGKAEHAVLARHYLIQAIKLDRQVNIDLWLQIQSGKPFEEIRAPRFALNRRMFLSVFGHTNRYKNLGLMRWLSNKLPRIQRFKKMDLQYYTDLRDRRGTPLSQSLIDAESETETAAMAASLPSHDFRSLLPLMIQNQRVPSPRIAVNLKNLGTAFDVDVNQQSTLEAPTEKTFNLDLHLHILEKDIAELAAFASNLDQVLGRTTQKRKERLGRRVWAGKDIYLSTENSRAVVSRERWRDIVRFKPRRELVARARAQSLHPVPHAREAAPHLQAQSQRSLSTLAGPPADTDKSSLSTTMLSKIRSLLPS